MTKGVKVILSGAMAKNSPSQTGTLKSRMVNDMKTVCTYCHQLRKESGTTESVITNLGSSVVFFHRVFIQSFSDS